VSQGLIRNEAGVNDGPSPGGEVTSKYFLAKESNIQASKPGHVGEATAGTSGNRIRIRDEGSPKKTGEK